MTEGNPWNLLSVHGVDARRVDPNGKQDFFWVISGKGEPGLLLRLAPGVSEPKSLPKMRNLDLAFQDVNGGRALLMVLRDAEQRDLFLSLCLDIIKAAEAAPDSTEGVHRAVRRAMRWHHLLRGGRDGRLSLEEQRGLMGELQFLKRLADLIGPFAAIEAWKGPSGSAKDFELPATLVEVKARRGAAKPFVQISSEDQLADVEGSRVFLVVSAIDAAIMPNGKTLTDHVIEIEKLYAAAEPEAYTLWELAISETGFDFDHDYSDRRWAVGPTAEFAVAEEFPRITTPLKTGVSGVRYSIALDACASFKVETGMLDSVILEGLGNGQTD